jgi:hypothetical protein
MDDEPLFGGLITPPVDLLDRFISLADTSDEAILQFVLKYGTLCRPMPKVDYPGPRRKGGAPLLEGSEPLSRWRQLSRNASNILEIAAALKSESTLAAERLGVLMAPGKDYLGDLSTEMDRKRYEFFGKRPERLGKWARTEHALKRVAREHLELSLKTWNSRLGPVTFDINYDKSSETGFKVVIDFGESLPCYIGFQLMLVVTGGDVFICSGCGHPYVRARGRGAPQGMRKAPKQNERNYCQAEECIRVRNRLASQRRRDRIKGGQN